MQSIHCWFLHTIAVSLSLNWGIFCSCSICHQKENLPDASVICNLYSPPYHPPTDYSATSLTVCLVPLLSSVDLAQFSVSPGSPSASAGYHRSDSGTCPMVNSIQLSCIARNLSSGFPTRSDKNHAVQPQKLARRLKFLDLGSKGIALSL